MGSATPQVPVQKRLQDLWYAPVAQVNETGAKRLRVDQLQVDPFVQGREVRRAATGHRIDQLAHRGPPLVVRRDATSRPTSPAYPRRAAASRRSETAQSRSCETATSHLCETDGTERDP